MISEVSNIFRLRDKDQGYVELQKEIEKNIKEKPEFVWSQQMLYITSIRNLDNIPSNTFTDTQQIQKFSQISQQDKEKISAIMVKYLLVPVCEKYSLESQSTLKLLTSYFCEFPQMFYQISRIEFKISQIENEIVQQDQKLNQLVQQIQSQQPQQWQNQLNQINQPINLNNYLMQNPLYQQQRLVYDSLNQKHRKLHEKFEELTIQIIDQLLLFQMRERIFLLKNINLIIQNSDPQLMIQSKFLFQMRNKLLRQGELIRKLIEFLNRNLLWDIYEFQKVNDLSRTSLIESLHEQQIVILQIIFKISLQQDVKKQIDIDLSHIVMFYDYLSANGFSGKLMNQNIDDINLINLQIYSQERMVENQILQQLKIRDLGLLTFLQILQIQKFSVNQDNVQNNQELKNAVKVWYSDAQEGERKFQELIQKINNTIVDPLNSIANLSLIMIFKLLEISTKFQENLVENSIKSNFIQQLEIIMKDSPLFSNFTECIEDPQILIFQLYKTAQSFINLIYDPILEKYKMEDEISIVRKITLDVFANNQELLNEMWKQMDLRISEQNDGIQQKGKLLNFNIIKMYEYFFQNPIEELQVFTCILNKMSGSNHSSQAVNTFKFLDNSSVDSNGKLLSFKDNQQQQQKLLRELLVVWMILLSQLEQFNLGFQADFQQELFDQLMNIIVIMSKILRQVPKSFEHINNEIEEICQYPQQYAFINLYGKSSISLDDSIQIQFSKFNDDKQKVLALLVNTLFQLIQVNDAQIIQKELKHVLDAISSVFAIFQDQRKDIFNLILYNQDYYKINLTSYFLNQSQSPNKNEYQLSFMLAYLKFITKIFKIQQPQSLLDESQQAQLHKSILEQMLRGYYKKMVDQFYKIEFQSLSDFCKLAKRILKLTYVLLEKFDCGNSAIIKIEVVQPCPYFDSLLNLIHSQISNLSLNLITSVLDLDEKQEMKQIKSAFSKNNLKNKYIQILISNLQRQKQMNQFSQSLDAQKQKNQINDMVTQSLKCLNQVLRLCFQNETFENYIEQQKQNKNNIQDFRGVKAYYIQSINMVHALKQQIQSPFGQTQISNYEQKYNIVSLLAFYVKFESIIESQANLSEIYMQNKTLSLGCLKQVCLIYQASSTKVDLMQMILKNNFFQQADLESIFLVPIFVNLNGINQMLKSLQNILLVERKISQLSKNIVQMFEVLTFCSFSQKSLISDLFSLTQFNQQKQNVLGQVIQEISNFFSKNIQEFQSQKIIDICTNLGQKIVHFLSLISQERIGLTFLKNLFELEIQLYRSVQIDLNANSNFRIIRNIAYNHVIPIWINKYANKTKQLDLIINDLEKKENNIKNQFMRNYFESIISTVEFLKLVQSLYSIDPTNNQPLREIVEEIYCSNSFGKFLNFQFDFSLKDQLNLIYQNLYQINQCFKNNSKLENVQLMNGDYQDAAFKQSLWNFLQRDQVIENEVLNQTQNHKLASKPSNQSQPFSSCAIYLSEFDTLQSCHFLNFLKTKIMGPSLSTHLTQNAIKHQFQEFYSPAGGLGSEFLICTSDLKYILQTQGYNINSWAVDELIKWSQSFNLGISCLYSLNALEECKDKFIMSIGRSKLRENQKINPCFLTYKENAVIQNISLLNNDMKNFEKSPTSDAFILSTSLFSLVNQSFPEKQNGEVIQDEYFLNINLLVIKNFVNLQEQFQNLNDKKQNQQIFMFQKYNETCFVNLHNCLTIMSLIFSSKFINKQNEEILQKSEIQEYIFKNLLVELPKIYQQLITVLVNNTGYIQNQMEAIDYREKQFTDSSKLTKQEAKYQQIFVSSLFYCFQILDSLKTEQLYINNNQRQSLIMSCISKIVSIMQKLPSQQIKNVEVQENYQNLFQNCISAIQIAFSFLNKSSKEDIINSHQNQPLKPVIRRLIEKNQILKQDDQLLQGIEETVLIIQFLNVFSKTQSGALYLFQENIFSCILQNKYVIQSINHSFYSEQGNIQLTNELNLLQAYGQGQNLVRNPFNVLWCHVLVLIRNMNQIFLENDFEGSIIENYLSKLVHMLYQHNIDQRISKLLCSVAHNSSLPITHGLLEESELTLNIIFQMFMHAQVLKKINNGMLQSLKDCLIFGTSSLICQLPIEYNSQLIPVTASEQYLHGQEIDFNKNEQELSKNDKEQYKLPIKNEMNIFSSYQIKTQSHFIKIHQLYSASLFDLMQQHIQSINILDASDQIFPNWSYVNDQIGNSHYEEFNKSYICTQLGNQLKRFCNFGQSDKIISIAYEQIHHAFSRMFELYKIWDDKMEDLKKVYDKYQKVFKNDQLICDEYKFLNQVFVIINGEDKDFKDDFSVILEILNQGLQMNEHLIIDFQKQF